MLTNVYKHLEVGNHKNRFTVELETHTITRIKAAKKHSYFFLQISFVRKNLRQILLKKMLSDRLRC